MIGGDKERKAIILQKLRGMKSLMLSNVCVKIIVMTIKNAHHFS